MYMHDTDLFEALDNSSERSSEARITEIILRLIKVL